MWLMRKWDGFRRGMRLLRRIGAGRGRSDLDAVVDEALASAVERQEHLDRLYQRGADELAALGRRVDKRFKGSSHELHDFTRTVRFTLERLAQDFLAQGEQTKQVFAATHMAALEQARASRDALEGVNAQVAALREYLAKQQEQVRRLQEGYDWTVTRDFCLRVIRCIDNIDRRQHGDASDGDDDVLEQVRDELVFALEASGVEPFAPETGEAYRGREKTTEVVDREPTPEGETPGTIARVVRPGYVHYVDDETTKVIRPAQVTVFTASETEGSHDAHRGN